ncbi:unnamed protein product [Lasius platythorax]|uniref:Uncharacterized protein n=1 Tax=Lasius platythorax TaxID=488582 RepID=A0AAV2ND55_9HYME
MFLGGPDAESHIVVIRSSPDKSEQEQVRKCLPSLPCSNREEKRYSRAPEEREHTDGGEPNYEEAETREGRGHRRGAYRSNQV